MIFKEKDDDGREIVTAMKNVFLCKAKNRYQISEIAKSNSSKRKKLICFHRYTPCLHCE